MKRKLKIILAAALGAALLLIALLPAAGTTIPSVYLMAVNDTVVEMTADNMPMVVDGSLYIPYTMLSSRHNGGINMGVTAQYSTTRRTVLVSSGQMGVIFDTQTNSAADLQGNPLDARAAVRNAMVFLPLHWVCRYFGSITYSLLRTPYGTLVRVTNSAVILPDLDFADAASNLLSENLRRYQDSIQPPAPVVSDTPAPSNPAWTAPSDSPVPEEGPVVYPAVRWGDRAEDALRLLENRNQRALFLFAPGELAANDTLVRRLAGSGHTVGLVLSGSTAEECLAEAEEGGRLLAAVARCPAIILEAGGLSGAERDELTGAGYVLWDPTARGEDYVYASSLVRALSGRRANYVEFSCDEAGLAMLQNALSAFDGAACRLRQATPPALSNEVNR